ncbi:hypothetical protein EDD86DRAFT_140040 [Gorgonomyces haynaldii]|nr:hypothetical protein EDD86DRAFT_140040 [Gorgonomyces haynaldii]
MVETDVEMTVKSQADNALDEIEVQVAELRNILRATPASVAAENSRLHSFKNHPQQNDISRALSDFPQLETRFKNVVPCVDPVYRIMPSNYLTDAQKDSAEKFKILMQHPIALVCLAIAGVVKWDEHLVLQRTLSQKQVTQLWYTFEAPTNVTDQTFHHSRSSKSTESADRTPKSSPPTKSLALSYFILFGDLNNVEFDGVFQKGYGFTTRGDAFHSNVNGLHQLVCTTCFGSQALEYYSNGTANQRQRSRFDHRCPKPVDTQKRIENALSALATMLAGVDGICATHRKPYPCPDCMNNEEHEDPTVPSKEDESEESDAVKKEPVDEPRRSSVSGGSFAAEPLTDMSGITLVNDDDLERAKLAAKKSPSLLFFIDKKDMTVKELGSGSFGKVSQYVYNPELTIAVKWYNDQEQERLFVELAAYLKLKHFNIVKCLGNAQNVQNLREVSLVLECMDTDLRKYFEQENPDNRTRTSYCIQLCRAIEHMHSQHFIHGDIRLRNTLLKNGRVKICDMGSTSQFVGQDVSGIKRDLHDLTLVIYRMFAEDFMKAVDATSVDLDNLKDASIQRLIQEWLSDKHLSVQKMRKQLESRMTVFTLDDGLHVNLRDFYPFELGSNFTELIDDIYGFTLHWKQLHLKEGQEVAIKRINKATLDARHLSIWAVPSHLKLEQQYLELHFSKEKLKSVSVVVKTKDPKDLWRFWLDMLHLSEDISEQIADLSINASKHIHTLKGNRHKIKISKQETNDWYELRCECAIRERVWPSEFLQQTS